MREGGRERDLQRERERERDRQTDRQTGRLTETERESVKEREDCVCLCQCAYEYCSFLLANFGGELTYTVEQGNLQTTHYSFSMVKITTNS